MPSQTITDSDMKSVMGVAQALLETLFTSVGMKESHGLGHCLTVLAHMEVALSCPGMTPQVRGQLVPRRQLSLRLAALLHEADDHKFFGAESRNCRDILEKSLTGVTERELIQEEVEEMISYVSASVNGNTVPEKAKEDPSLLWPRFCDRLEAIGISGAVRCYQYNNEVNDPLVTDSMPRPTTVEEVWSSVTPERWASYQNGGSSASMMDHYYDKLLQIAVFPEEVVQCPYLVEEANKRVQPLIDICLEAGRTGEAPVDLIMSHQLKMK